jgi:hypothetical protein
MFEKKRIAFSIKRIFGSKFKPSIDICFCTVSKMLFNGKINTDGTIDITQLANLKIDELWSYIYYLYFYNHTNVTVFKSMKNETNGKASAEQFYGTVISMAEVEVETLNINSQPAKAFDPTTLIIFINEVIEEFGKELINPVFDYLGILLKKNILTRLSGITIKTNETSNSVDNNKIKIVTDNAGIKNANVKFSLSLEDDIESK